MSRTKRVLSVGQCFADHGSISRTITTHFNAEIVKVDTADEALATLRDGGIDLVLVNRVFDADGGTGLGLIKHIKADERLTSVPTMLVSNYDQYQQEATKLGAMPGFGKASLGQPQMLQRLEIFLPRLRQPS
jgi:hypothetical protein